MNQSNGQSWAPEPAAQIPVRLRHRLDYLGCRVLLALINALPERLAYGIVGAAGRLYFRCSKARRAAALRMLRNAYASTKTDDQLLRIGRLATGNIFKVILDMTRMGRWLESGRIHERIDFATLHRLPQPPFLALSGHLGSWEIAALAGALLRGETHVIARTFKNPLLQAYLLASRRRVGLHIHPKRGGIRALARALENGQVGAQAVDQHQRLRGVRVPFFGELASSERAAATLALRQGYPISVGAVIRVGSGFCFRGVLLDDAFVPVATGDHETDVKAVVTEINRRLERLVLAYPEQYLWIHNRYRDQPSEPEFAPRSPPTPLPDDTPPP